MTTPEELNAAWDQRRTVNVTTLVMIANMHLDACDFDDPDAYPDVDYLNLCRAQWAIHKVELIALKDLAGSYLAEPKDGQRIGREGFEPGLNEDNIKERQATDTRSIVSCGKRMDHGPHAVGEHGWCLGERRGFEGMAKAKLCGEFSNHPPHMWDFVLAIEENRTDEKYWCSGEGSWTSAG